MSKIFFLKKEAEGRITYSAPSPPPLVTDAGVDLPSSRVPSRGYVNIAVRRILSLDIRTFAIASPSSTDFSSLLSDHMWCHKVDTITAVDVGGKIVSTVIPPGVIVPSVVSSIPTSGMASNMKISAKPVLPPTSAKEKLKDSQSRESDEAIHDKGEMQGGSSVVAENLSRIGQEDGSSSGKPHTVVSSGPITDAADTS